MRGSRLLYGSIENDSTHDLVMSRIRQVSIHRRLAKYLRRNGFSRFFASYGEASSTRVSLTYGRRIYEAGASFAASFQAGALVILHIFFEIVFREGGVCTHRT